MGVKIRVISRKGILKKERLERMDGEADEVIRNWSVGAFVGNLLPPPLDLIVVGAAFARMGQRLGQVYGEEVSWSVLKRIGRAIAKGVGVVLGASYIGTGLLKWIPGVNIWVALLVQPPIVAAVAYSVGSAFKRYYHLKLSGEDLTPEQMRKLAEDALNEKLRAGSIG